MKRVKKNTSFLFNEIRKKIDSLPLINDSSQFFCFRRLIQKQCFLQSRTRTRVDLSARNNPSNNLIRVLNFHFGNNWKAAFNASYATLGQVANLIKQQPSAHVPANRSSFMSTQSRVDMQLFLSSRLTHKLSETIEKNWTPLRLSWYHRFKTKLKASAVNIQKILASNGRQG